MVTGGLGLKNNIIKSQHPLGFFCYTRQYIGGGYVRKLVKCQTRSGVSLQDGED